MLQEKLPDAKFVNASRVMNEAVVVKEPAEIERIRKAADIVDAGIKASLKALKVGVTETAVVGAGEKAMRELGSMWNWPITGGDEISSGYRGGYSRCGCTPPQTRQLKKEK
ncbi:MAG: M24 family metallopeptidase [Candidatus Freyarchaeota archaeon]|nr:hypothetical protein [Candidatus Freyrarchaeum guaymaensis]